MPWTKITRCLPSVWKETRSLTKTVPDGGAGAGNSTDCCESGFMRLACSTDQREEKRKSQRSEPTTGKPKSGQVLVRTQGGKKGRTVVAPDRRHCNHAGSSLISSNSRAANLQRKTQKADRFWFALGAVKKQASGGSGKGAAATMRGCSLISSNSGVATFNGKHKKRTGFGSHPVKVKPKSINYSRGMSGVLKVRVRIPRGIEIDRRLHTRPFRLRHRWVGAKQIVEFQTSPPGDRTPAFNANQPGNLLMHREAS